MQKIQGQVQDFAAYTAEAHEETMLIVEAHNCALALSILQHAINHTVAHRALFCVEDCSATLSYSSPQRLQHQGRIGRDTY